MKWVHLAIAVLPGLIACGNGASSANSIGTVSVNLEKKSTCGETAASADPPKTMLTASSDAGLVHVILHDLGDYCGANSTVHVEQKPDGIHLIKSKPTNVTRCLCVNDVSYAIKGLGSGSYSIFYEEIPYVGETTKPVLIAKGEATVP